VLGGESGLKRGVVSACVGEQKQQDEPRARSVRRCSAVSGTSPGDGAIAVLRQGGPEEGAVDAGGGSEAARLH
jgi:hypothetical protein